MEAGHTHHADPLDVRLLDAQVGAQDGDGDPPAHRPVVGDDLMRVEEGRRGGGGERSNEEGEEREGSWRNPTTDEKLSGWKVKVR